MAPKRGLGRGLSNLIPTDDTTEDVTTKTSKQTKTGTVTKTEIVKKVEQTLNTKKRVQRRCIAGACRFHQTVWCD